MIASPAQTVLDRHSERAEALAMERAVAAKNYATANPGLLEFIKDLNRAGFKIRWRQVDIKPSRKIEHVAHVSPEYFMRRKK